MWIWRPLVAFIVLASFIYLFFQLTGPDPGYNKWRFHGRGDFKRDR